MERWLYCSDVDGTLARQGFGLTEDTCRLVHQMVEQDILFTIVTGRYLSTSLPVIEACHLKVPAICLSGSLIYHCEKKQIEKVWAIDSATAEKVAQCLQSLQNPYSLVLYKDEEQRCLLYGTEPSKYGASTLRNNLGLIHDEERVQSDLCSCVTEGQVLIFDMVGGEQTLRKVCELLQELQEIECYLHQSPYNPSRWILDVVAAGSGKGTALRWLKEQLGADYSAAFGDNYNDLPMLQAADLAVVVAEAPNPVKEAADVILPPTVNCVPDFILQRENRK